MGRDPVEEAVQDSVIKILGSFALLFWCVPAGVFWWELYKGVLAPTLPVFVGLVGHAVVTTALLWSALRPDRPGEGNQIAGSVSTPLLSTTGVRHRRPKRGPKPHVPDVTFQDLRARDFDGVEAYDVLANPLRVKETLNMHVRALCVERLAELHPARALKDATLPDMVRLRAIEVLAGDEAGRGVLAQARGELRGDLAAALARALGSEWAGQLELTEAQGGGDLEMLDGQGGLTMREE